MQQDAQISTATTSPTLTSPTLITLVVAALAGLPELAHSLMAVDLGLNTGVRHGLAVAALAAAWLSPILTRWAAVKSAQANEAKIATVAQVTADHIDPQVPTTMVQTVGTLREVAESAP